jgi:hypothetical protein
MYICRPARDHHFIEMPPTVGFRPYRTQVLGNYWPEFKNPPTDRFIADHQSALSQKILNIPIAQREPEVEPDSMSMTSGGNGVGAEPRVEELALPKSLKSCNFTLANAVIRWISVLSPLAG